MCRVGQRNVRKGRDPQLTGHITGAGTLHGHTLLGHEVSSTCHGEVSTPCCPAPPSADEDSFRKSFRHVNNDSGRGSFFIHSVPESLFTSPRNPYSHQPGTIIHMPRNTHQTEFDWGTVQKALLTAVLPMTVQAVNQRTGAA